MSVPLDQIDTVIMISSLQSYKATLKDFDPIESNKAIVTNIKLERNEKCICGFTF